MKTPNLLLLTLLLTAAPGFAKDDEGKIVSVSARAITIGKKHPSSYKITAATVITLNGAAVGVVALRSGMSAEVTAHAGVAASVDAVDTQLKMGSLDSNHLKQKKK